jgi:mRNA interferase RelE/StbE
VPYTVRFEARAEKALSSLDVAIQRRIVAKVETLAAEPRPAGVKALQGSEGLYRLDVGHRREVYR